MPIDPDKYRKKRNKPMFNIKVVERSSWAKYAGKTLIPTSVKL